MTHTAVKDNCRSSNSDTLSAQADNIVSHMSLFLTYHRRTLAWVLVLMLTCLPFAQADQPSERIEAEGQSTDLADLDIEQLARIRVSPFDVAAYLDRGYRASNAVSASRFDAPIRELPFAIQAFTQNFIEDQKPENLFDIARYSPGITYRSNDFNEGNANLAIRGFPVSATKGNIQVLRDGFNGPSIFDFTNISRVEVVKGPSSFLYGQVAPGGIVNVITKTPQSRPTSRVDLSYGSYDQYRLDADITGPVSNDLFFRLATSYDEDIHYWEPYDAYSWDFAPSLLWQPNDRMSLSLRYEKYKKVERPQVMQKPGYGPQTGIVPTATDPNLSGVEVPGLQDDWNGLSYADYRNSDTRSFSGWIDYKLDERWSLRTGYSHQFYEVDALFTGNFGMANNSTLLQGRRVRGQTYTNEGDTLEAHAVGNYDFGSTSLRLLLGAQYVDRQFSDWAAQAPNDPLLGSNPTASPLPLWDLSDPSTWDRDATVPRSALTENKTDYSVAYQDKSLYGSSTFGFYDNRLLLLAGWRLTLTENRLTDHLTGVSGPTFSEREVTPQYGVMYKINPGLSLFASYAESFLPGSQVLRHPDGSTSTAIPTEGQGYDIGLKASLFGGRVSGTLTFFDIRNRNIVNDLAITDSLGSVVIYNVQSGEQRSQGVELDTSATLSDNWQLYVSYSYMDARITEFSGNDDAVLALDPSTLSASELENYRNVRRFHDAPLQMSAPHLVNLWTRYDFTSDPLRGAYVAGGVNYVRDQTLLPDGPDSSHQTYTLVNAKAGYEWNWRGKRLSLDLMGKNLTDEHYRPSQSTRSRPREFLLTLSARF
jgi:iron complex outermembrane receptor protein